jgi:hypothetical protein
VQILRKWEQKTTVFHHPMNVGMINHYFRVQFYPRTHQNLVEYVQVLNQTIIDEVESKCEIVLGFEGGLLRGHGNGPFTIE